MPKRKATSKVETVISLAQRKRGCTLADIEKKLKVSSMAASSLIGDARRRGTKVRFAEGVYRA